MARPLILGMIKKLTGPVALPFEGLIPLTDRSYQSDENCDGCGICAQVCPVSNIEMVDHRPSWRHHCETCVACFHWCPKKAIHGGLSSRLEDYRYHHPEVKLADMLHPNKTQ